MGLLIVNSIGYFGIFRWHQYGLRQEMKQAIKQGLPEDQLTHFRFSHDDYAQLDWEEDGREFRFNNRMYDVVRMHRSATYVEVACVHDEQETRLFAQLDEWVYHQFREYPEPGTTVLFHWLRLYTASSSESMTQDVEEVLSTPKTPYFLNTAQGYTSLPEHPPQPAC